MHAQSAIMTVRDAGLVARFNRFFKQGYGLAMQEESGLSRRRVPASSPAARTCGKPDAPTGSRVGATIDAIGLGYRDGQPCREFRRARAESKALAARPSSLALHVGSKQTIHLCNDGENSINCPSSSYYRISTASRNAPMVNLGPPRPTP